MFTSFSTALSALDATSTAIDVVGNNLANLNTTGYKTSVTSFHDLVTQSLGAGLGDTQVGFGVARPLTIRQFTQGAVQASSGLMDAAIQGDGFFVLRDDNNSQLFTRSGSFQVDREGNMLSTTGQRVQGWTMVNGVVNTNSNIGDIVVPVGQLRQPVVTSEFSVDLNLNAAAVAGSTATGSFSVPIEVVDSLGNTQALTVTFTKDATTARQWNYDIFIDGGAVSGGTAGTPFSILGGTTGTLTFDENGTLSSPALADGNIPISITGLTDNAADMNMTWKLYNSGDSARITQYTQASASSARYQNGSVAAQLQSVAVGDNGAILARYSNGTQEMVGKLAMAAVRNPESLIAVGDSAFQAAADTAMPSIGEAGTGGRGSILGGSLESSTVDIAEEFTNLIVLQRGYQANSRIVTTVDQISEETINLKR